MPASASTCDRGKGGHLHTGRDDQRIDIVHAQAAGDVDQCQWIAAADGAPPLFYGEILCLLAFRL
jgi:hypothetical protein